MNTGKHNPRPLVSVLMSTYNRPHYLRQALASVLAQTWEPIEIILVRDGGLPVREVIADFLDDSRLVFIDRDVNRGKPSSFNEALQRARGEYVCYLDDDDLFYPFHVETLATALGAQDRCQAVYSDLYKAHCRVLPDGRRRVLAKNVEVSRDFDRMLMLQFNQALHVSLMHRRDLLDKTGPYNEKINVLIDWDMTRRLCFFTDFLHVPVVTGEFYAPVGDCDRISVKRRKNIEEYIWNVLTIRSTRPAKPWPCVGDLSIIVLPGKGGDLQQTLRDLWSHSFYPNQYIVPLTPSQRAAFASKVPNVICVSVAEAASEHARLDAALAACRGDHVAVVPCGIPIPPDEVSFLERSLYPLLRHGHRQTAYEVVESSPEHWAAVLGRDDLVRARQAHPDLPLVASLEAAGIALRKTTFEDYPLQFDCFMSIAAQDQREGDYDRAIAIYDMAQRDYGNALWMATLKANALYHKGDYAAAARQAAALNQRRPTVARLMIEARARRNLNDFSAAADLYRRAEAILDGNSTGYAQGRPEAVVESGTLAAAAAPQQETLIWTS